MFMLLTLLKVENSGIQIIISSVISCLAELFLLVASEPQRKHYLLICCFWGKREWVHFVIEITHWRSVWSISHPVVWCPIRWMNDQHQCIVWKILGRKFKAIIVHSLPEENLAASFEVDDRKNGGPLKCGLDGLLCLDILTKRDLEKWSGSGPVFETIGWMWVLLLLGQSNINPSNFLAQPVSLSWFA